MNPRILLIAALLAVTNHCITANAGNIDQYTNRTIALRSSQSGKFLTGFYAPEVLDAARLVPILNPDLGKNQTFSLISNSVGGYQIRTLNNWYIRSGHYWYETSSVTLQSFQNLAEQWDFTLVNGFYCIRNGYTQKYLVENLSGDPKVAANCTSQWQIVPVKVQGSLVTPVTPITPIIPVTQGTQPAQPVIKKPNWFVELISMI